MITPRRTRLLRVPDLPSMHGAVVDCVCSGSPLDARACAVLVPTRGAAATLRRTVENLLLGVEARTAVILPDFITRSELYAAIHRGCAGAPPLLSEFEREVLLRRAARRTARDGVTPPFRLRPGLIVQILAFYDDLRRRGRTIDDFDRIVTGSLESSAGIDRGAARMLVQTRFLVAAYREFERLSASSGSIDEHGLRQLLLGDGGTAPYRQFVITVPDQAADVTGLWSADYDLLARVTGLTRIDIVATEAQLAAGYHERIHDVFPGLEEERISLDIPPPALVVPEPSSGQPGPRWFVSRDREEELADVARLVKSYPELDRVAVTFQRPLPYLYLARQVFPDAGVPYQALDALPLAAEPFAAALDLVFTFAIAEGTRASLIDLLSSPHWRFECDGEVVNAQHVAALDRLLRERKYVGGWDRLAAIIPETVDRHESRARSARFRTAAPAAGAVAAAALEIRMAIDAPTASGQIRGFLAFLTAHERLATAADPWYEAHLRARAAILSALAALAEAHGRHDDEPLETTELANAVRRWIEGQTFSPRTGTHGVMLLDVQAAAYADIDDLRIIGLVEGDWPAPTRRNILYPASLLNHLGWPSDRDRLSAGRARFHDLLRLPRRRVSASTFTLEDDGIVASSPLLEELDAIELPIERRPPAAPSRVFVHEAISVAPIVAAAVQDDEAAWLALRLSRSADASDCFHGATGARAAGTYAVSHVERYLDCPFKYFASYVLRLDEERNDESGLTPQERGQFVHEVFHEFYSAWQRAGGREITPANVDSAVALFETVAEARLADLSESDRALERTHLLGSAVAPGLAERAFASEIEQGGGVLERLLEQPLEGEFTLQGADGPARRRIRAKADRIDLLTDGTLRLIDYKLSRAPKPSRALQLPVYGVCAEQHLEGRHGRSWRLARAGYVAFREKNAFVSVGATSLQQALADGQQRFLDAVAGIEQGDFPVSPDEPFLCTRCGYAGVCRKDYVGDE